MQPPKLLRRLAFVVLFATLTCLPAASPGNEVALAGVDLFEAAPPLPRPRVAAVEDTAVRTRRRVRVRRELLQAPAAVAAPLRFNLFPGEEFTAVLTRDERTANGDRVLGGTLAGVPDSQFLVVVHGEEVVADIFVSPLESYQLRREPGEDGAPEVRRLDPGALPPCGGGIVSPARHRPAPRPAQQAHEPVPRAEAPGDAGPADDPGTVDVLIAYTPAARVQLGGSVAAVEAQAQLAVQGMNDRLRGSQVRTQARLVHTMEVAYAEVGGDLITDLTNLEDPTGVLMAVHQARDLYAADLVSLFVAGPPAGTTGSFVIGLATFAVELDGNGQVQGIPELGFTVVEPFYDVANTFAHELGHNFGCQHDREHVVVDGVDYGPGLFPFSYGWRFDSAGHTYRDLMSYSPGTIIPFYSNPQVTYGYTATGVTDVADNARTMNASAAAVANLRRLPAVSITAPVPRAFETPTIPGQFTVARTGSTARPLTVNLRVSFIGGAASFETLPDRITIPAGQTSVDLPAVPVDDNRSEERRGVTVEVLTGDGYRLVAAPPAATRATVYLLDTLETVSITTTQPTATRDPLRAGSFRLTRSGALDAPLTVFLRLDERSQPVNLFGARKNYRFDPPLTRLDPPIIGESSAFNYSVDIPSGSATLDLTLTPDQSALDAIQVLAVNVVERDRYQAGQPRAAVNILDRPMEVTLPELSIVAVEPTASATTGRVGRFLLTRSGGVESTQLVSIYLSGNAAYGLDYSTNDSYRVNHDESGFQGYFFIPAGEASLALEVRPEVDPRAPTRTVLATVGPTGSPLTTTAPTAAVATVTILGQPVVTVTVTGPEARATSDLGPVNGEFTLHREGDLSEPLTVRYKAAGTAVAGNRCKVLPGMATFPAGQDFVRVKVKPKGNAGGPGAKTNVKLTLQPGEGYVLGSEARVKVKVFGGE